MKKGKAYELEALIRKLDDLVQRGVRNTGILGYYQAAAVCDARHNSLHSGHPKGRQHHSADGDQSTHQSRELDSIPATPVGLGLMPN